MPGISRRFNFIAQALCIVIHSFNAAGLIPDPYWSKFAMVSVGTLQSIVGLYAHMFNPDGSPAQVAFEKKG